MPTWYVKHACMLILLLSRPAVSGQAWPPAAGFVAAVAHDQSPHTSHSFFCSVHAFLICCATAHVVILSRYRLWQYKTASLCVHEPASMLISTQCSRVAALTAFLPVCQNSCSVFTLGSVQFYRIQSSRWSGCSAICSCWRQQQAWQVIHVPSVSPYSATNRC